MNAPIHAVVPIKETSDAKRRLADVLCAARRQELALAMFEDVLATLTGVRELAGIVAVTVDPAAATIAARYGARVSNAGAREGHTGAGHYRFRHAARMEWIKLRSLRSTWWTLAITVAGAVAIGVTVGLNTRNAAGDLTNNALAGIVPGLLLAGVLGVLTMTGEYTSGMIRATLAAIPRRPLCPSQHHQTAQRSQDRQLRFPRLLRMRLA